MGLQLPITDNAGVEHELAYLRIRAITVNQKDGFVEIVLDFYHSYAARTNNLLPFQSRDYTVPISLGFNPSTFGENENHLSRAYDYIHENEYPAATNC